MRIPAELIDLGLVRIPAELIDLGLVRIPAELIDNRPLDCVGGCQ